MWNSESTIKEKLFLINYELQFVKINFKLIVDFINFKFTIAIHDS